MSLGNHLKQLQSISSGFKSFWNRPDNLSKKIDGSFTPCGLWSEYGAYLEKKMEKPPRKDEKQSDRFSPDELPRLSEFLESIVSNSESGYGSHKGEESHEAGAPDEGEMLRQAVKTCFLENLIHKPLLQKISDYLGPETLAFVNSWNREE